MAHSEGHGTRLAGVKSMYGHTILGHRDRTSERLSDLRQVSYLTESLQKMNHELRAHSRYGMGSPVGKIHSPRDVPSTWHAADTLFILVIVVLSWNYPLRAWGFNSFTWIRVPASILTIGVFLRKCQCLKPAFLYWNSDNNAIMSFYGFRGTTRVLCTELSRYRTVAVTCQGHFAFFVVCCSSVTCLMRTPAHPSLRGLGMAQVNCSLLLEQPSFHTKRIKRTPNFEAGGDMPNSLAVLLSLPCAKYWVL